MSQKKITPKNEKKSTVPNFFCGVLKENRMFGSLQKKFWANSCFGTTKNDIPVEIFMLR